MVRVYNKETIESLIDGYWYRAPSKEWYAETVTISKGEVKREGARKKLFIAMDSEVWHKGSGSSGIYAGWTDTHTLVKGIENSINGIIVQRPIEDIDASIPQYVTDNTYEVIRLLGDYAYEQLRGKMIAITGTAGKSTCKNLFQHIIQQLHTVVATRGNHNTRTGVPLTIACAINNPDYLVVESAISGLWMRQGGILKDYPPQVALITSIDGGQQKTAYETAVLKARVAEGMNHQGLVIINKESKEFTVLKETVAAYNENIITYGLDESADSYLVNYTEVKSKASLTLNVLGEEVTMVTHLLGKAMAQNILGVLTTLKSLKFSLDQVIPFVETYKPVQGVQNFQVEDLADNKSYTILDDSWNATGIAMLEAIDLFKRQSIYYTGKKIAILGRIENLGEQEAKRQHEALADPIIDSDIDLVFAHGPEMKYLLKKIPETMIGGYFENSKQLASAVAPLITNDDFVLLKGSPRSSDFKHVKRDLINAVKKGKRAITYSIDHPYATGAGAMTFDLETNSIVGSSGNIQATQNQGLGNLLLFKLIMDKLFSKELEASTKYLPGKQALRETKATNAVALNEGEEISLEAILATSIVHSAPNTLLMLANQVIGDNREALKQVRALGEQLNISVDAIGNLSGRRITNKKQQLTLPDLYNAAKALFQLYPGELSWFARQDCMYKDEFYHAKTNLFYKGYISHGIFYGYLHSIGAVLSQINGKKYITVVLGARDVYHRDHLIVQSLQGLNEEDEKEKETVIKTEKETYTMNIIGDTYFGEFYTRIRERQGRLDGLQSYGRNYSFDGIRPLLDAGDYNICNFEAALLQEEDHPILYEKENHLFY